MTYTIAVKPSKIHGKVTAASSNGHSLTTNTPLLDAARYWRNQNADPTATITTVWSSGPGHWSLRSTIGHAAKLTVEENQRDGPRFRKWAAFPGGTPTDEFSSAPPTLQPQQLRPLRWTQFR
jgi:hypothetical protein